MATVRIGVVRYMWGAVAPTAQTHPQWPDWAYHEIFQASNGWSAHDYWLRSTFGLIDAQFDIRPWRILRRDQGEMLDPALVLDWESSILMENRRLCLAAVRQQARDDGDSLDGYDGVIAFVHAPPCNSGASGGDALLDQGGFLSFYLHEVGHVLGFQHSYGPGGPYDDRYWASRVPGRMTRAT
jgi:hypothetical protein